MARKRHININFFVRLVPVFTGFVPGTNPVCPWDKSGEKQGQTQEFSLFYTVEARFHRVCPWDKPGLSQGQSRGRRAAQKVYVKNIYVPFSLARYGHGFPLLDDRQITHVICARLEYDLYVFFGGVFGPFIQEKEQEAGPKTPLKKSYRSYFRRAQTR